MTLTKFHLVLAPLLLRKPLGAVPSLLLSPFVRERAAATTIRTQDDHMRKHSRGVLGRAGRKKAEERSNASRWQVERREKVEFFKKSFSSLLPVIRETTLDYRRDDTFGSRTRVNDG